MHAYLNSSRRGHTSILSLGAANIQLVIASRISSGIDLPHRSRIGARTEMSSAYSSSISIVSTTIISRMSASTRIAALSSFPVARSPATSFLSVRIPPPFLFRMSLSLARHSLNVVLRRAVLLTNIPLPFPSQANTTAHTDGWRPRTDGAAFARERDICLD